MFPQHLSSMCGCALLPRCDGSPSGIDARKHVWVYAKVLLAKQKLLALLFLLRIQIISPCQVGQAKQTPGGEATASGPATLLCLSSPALWILRVMHRSDSRFFFIYFFIFPTVLHLHKPISSCPSHQSEKQLAYLLTYSSVEPSPVPVSGARWKKGKSGRATVLSRELTECLHRQLYSLPAGDDILTSFYRPLEDKAEAGEAL